ncbi:hypothetical protein D3C81_1553870 [compost metagenome]
MAVAGQAAVVPGIEPATNLRVITGTGHGDIVVLLVQLADRLGDRGMPGDGQLNGARHFEVVGDCMTGGSRLAGTERITR